jgi:hypothetical protein
VIGPVPAQLAGSRGECQDGRPSVPAAPAVLAGPDAARLAYRMAESWPAIRLRGIGRAFMALVGRIRFGSTRGQFTIHTDKVTQWVTCVILIPAARG